MSTTTLIRLGGLAAIGAGVLRIISSFIPYSEGNTALEILYLIIDSLILLALLGVYGYLHSRIGKVGFIGFLLALLGTAIIVGPDGKIGTVDMYTVGSLMLSIGLALLALVSWKRQQLPRSASLCWLVSTIVGIGGYSVGLTSSFVMAGVMFGLGFVTAGVKLLNPIAQMP
jgi:drug/metabolite transporter (DMT)-like permease